jgi:hypothetical protein
MAQPGGPRSLFQHDSALISGPQPGRLFVAPAIRTRGSAPLTVHFILQLLEQRCSSLIVTEIMQLYRAELFVGPRKPVSWATVTARNMDSFARSESPFRHRRARRRGARAKVDRCSYRLFQRCAAS